MEPHSGGAAGAIISTASDMGRYALALVHGDLSSADSLSQMFESRSSAKWPDRSATGS